MAPSGSAGEVASRWRAMALDVGERRVGVAVSDELRAIASPLATVQRGPRDLQEIRDLIRTWGVTHLVVGLPTGLSGREGPQAALVRSFAAKLEGALDTGVRMLFWDERLTTAIAERSLIASGTSRARRKERVDAVAAAVLLQSYLDAGRTGSNRPW
ncbi:MAG: Holliday junction resolvase RuvX [Chloroflexia bacterium]|nr:Holliday junction resolvase RuvX [Chloroflexia bacterium]